MNKYERALSELFFYIDDREIENEISNKEYQEDVYLPLQELVERATPKKPHSPDRFRDFYCPTCGEIVLKDECCGNNDCRQCIDWSE